MTLRHENRKITKFLYMLEPVRTARVLGSLVLIQGAFFLLFWKIFSITISIGAARYASFSGKMAKAFFFQDKALIKLLQTGEAFLTPLLVLGIAISLLGILIIAFPKQTVQILVALRVLKRG
jgi:hypothetical protein